MTDAPASYTQIPPFATTLLGDFAQKGLTILATSAAASGFILPGHVPEIVSGAVAFLLFLASCGWTYVAARLRRRRLVTAISSPAAIPVTTLPTTVAALKAAKILPQSQPPKGTPP